MTEIKEGFAYIHTFLGLDTADIRCDICTLPIIKGQRLACAKECEHAWHMECFNKWVDFHKDKEKKVACATCNVEIELDDVYPKLVPQDPPKETRVPIVRAEP